MEGDDLLGRLDQARQSLYDALSKSQGLGEQKQLVQVEMFEAARHPLWDPPPPPYSSDSTLTCSPSIDRLISPLMMQAARYQWINSSNLSHRLLNTFHLACYSALFPHFELTLDMRVLPAYWIELMLSGLNVVQLRQSTMTSLQTSLEYLASFCIGAYLSTAQDHFSTGSSLPIDPTQWGHIQRQLCLRCQLFLHILRGFKPREWKQGAQYGMLYVLLITSYAFLFAKKITASRNTIHWALGLLVQVRTAHSKGQLIRDNKKQGRWEKAVGEQVISLAIRLSKTHVDRHQLATMLMATQLIQQEEQESQHDGREQRSDQEFTLDVEFTSCTKFSIPICSCFLLAYCQNYLTCQPLVEPVDGLGQEMIRWLTRVETYGHPAIAFQLYTIQAHLAQKNGHHQASLKWLNHAQSTFSKLKPCQVAFIRGLWVKRSTS